MKKHDRLAAIPEDNPDEIDQAIIEQINEEPLYFEIALPLEKIEANFKNVKVGDQIIEALSEVLQNI